MELIRVINNIMSADQHQRKVLTMISKVFPEEVQYNNDQTCKK